MSLCLASPPPLFCCLCIYVAATDAHANAYSHTQTMITIPLVHTPRVNKIHNNYVIIYEKRDHLGMMVITSSNLLFMDYGVIYEVIMGIQKFTGPSMER